MKIEFTVPFRRAPAPGTLLVEPPPQVQGRPPRIARLVALAHKLDALVRSGAITYAELARLGHISPRRVLRKSWFWCIWRRRSRNTFCFSPRVTLGLSPSWGCARSRVSRAGIASMRCLSDGSSPALDRHRDVFAM